MAKEKMMADIIRGSDYKAPEGGYFGKMPEYGLGKYGQRRPSTGGGGSVISPLDLANAMREFSPPEAFVREGVERPPPSLTGENVKGIRPNDKGGWDAQIDLGEEELTEVEVDSGAGSMISTNVGFLLSSGAITEDDIRGRETFNNDAPLNEGQMGIVDQWREQMGPDGSIKAYEPATNMLVELQPHELAGAMDAGYRFDPKTISTEYVGGTLMPNSPKRDFTPEEFANQEVNDPFANFRGKEHLLAEGLRIPPAPQQQGYRPPVQAPPQAQQAPQAPVAPPQAPVAPQGPQPAGQPDALDAAQRAKVNALRGGRGGRGGGGGPFGRRGLQARGM